MKSVILLSPNLSTLPLFLFHPTVLILILTIPSVASIMRYILPGSLLRDNLDRLCSVLQSIAKQQV